MARNSGSKKGKSQGPSVVTKNVDTRELGRQPRTRIERTSRQHFAVSTKSGILLRTSATHSERSTPIPDAPTQSPELPPGGEQSQPRQPSDDETPMDVDPVIHTHDLSDLPKKKKKKQRRRTRSVSPSNLKRFSLMLRVLGIGALVGLEALS